MVDLILWFYKIFAVVLGLVLIWHFATKKMLNPYKLYMIFGKKGAGKTTTLCKLCFKHLKRGWTVYSTEPIPGAYHISPKDVGYFKIPPRSVLLIDEVGLVWHARKWKEFSDEVRKWFKYQRHEEVKVYMFSQSFDIDKSLRDLCDGLYLLENKFRIFSYARKIDKRFVINESTAEAPSNIAENLHFESFWWFWCGSRMFTYIPKYAPYFDSYSKLDLPGKEWLLVPIPDKKHYAASARRSTASECNRKEKGMKLWKVKRFVKRTCGYVWRRFVWRYVSRLLRLLGL